MLPPPAQPPARIEAAIPGPIAAAKADALAFLTGGAAVDGKALGAELRTALAAAERRPGKLHPATLTLRALAGLVLDRQGETRGLRIFAEACGALQRQRVLLSRAHGAAALETLPHLEALKELYGLEKLKADRWEDLALRIALRHSRGPRPDLERRVEAAIERHYGPFLSFRPPDREAVLEDVAMLVSLWSRRSDRAQRTQAFVAAGFRSDAAGVWKLVARHAGESLREEMRALLSTLDPDTLRTELQGFLAWLPEQASAPWAEAARALARAVEASAEKAKLAPAAALVQRVRLARALGERERAVNLVIDALANPGEDRAPLLVLAQELLEVEPSGPLRQSFRAALRLEAPVLLAVGGNPELIVQEARRLDQDGEFQEAEGWWRSLLGGAGLLAADAAQEALGCNLAAQGRWEEARALLEPLAAQEKRGRDPGLRFRLAAGEAAAGDPAAALRWAREGVTLLPAEGPLEPVPGLATALRLLIDEPSAPALLARVRSSLDPEARIADLADPAALLGLLEGLEAKGTKPGPTSAAACGGPWATVGGDPLARGLALLQAAGGRRLEDAEPCLREAVRNLEQAWGDQDPRLMAPLLRLAQCLQDRSDPGAERVYRRILELGNANPDAEPSVDAEARARLGLLLAEQGRDAEADGLLRAALECLALRPVDSSTREIQKGVLLMLLSRLEYREDYVGIVAVLDQIGAAGAKGPESEGKPSDDRDAQEMVSYQLRFARLVQLQALLRAQGLP